MTFGRRRNWRAACGGQHLTLALSCMTALALSLAACASSNTLSEGLEPATLPTELRADYAVFAQRCSKCHSLDRPLTSGISDENYWLLYVSRMRRQPGSGITQEDAGPILRFLHYYSLEQQRKHEKAPPPAASGSEVSGFEQKRRPASLATARFGEEGAQQKE